MNFNGHEINLIKYIKIGITNYRTRAAFYGNIIYPVILAALKFNCSGGIGLGIALKS